MKPCPAACDDGSVPTGTCVADTCPTCTGEGVVESWYDRLPGARRLRRRWHMERYVLDRRRLERARHWRLLLREHKAWKAGRITTIGVWRVVSRNLLDDEPALKSFLEHELRRELKDHTPLLWRLDAIRRAWAGDLVDPYDYPTTITVRDDAAFFIRNQVVLLMECRRVPRPR